MSCHLGYYKFLLLFSLSVVSYSFVTPSTIVHQAPGSMEFPRQEYWSGLPFTFPSMYMYTKWYVYYFCGILKCKINKEIVIAWNIITMLEKVVIMIEASL